LIRYKEQPAIVVENVRRTFHSAARRRGILGGLFTRSAERVEALRGISFRVPEGCSTALLGANGAGKSSLLKVLAGVLQPTAGSVSVAGYDPWKERMLHRRAIGVVFGHRSQLWWDLPIQDTFRFLETVYGLDRETAAKQTARLVDLLRLSPLLRTPVRELSLGQRMRCEIAASLLHNPQVLLLDEPTIGLDLVSRIRLRGFLRLLTSESRTTLLFSSHDLLDVEGIATHLLILDEGRIAFDGTYDAFRTRQGKNSSVVSLQLDPPIPTSLLNSIVRLGASIASDAAAEDGRLTFRAEKETLNGILDHVLATGRLLDVRIERPTIEDVVLSLYEASEDHGAIHNS
jgi:ABC-2 type transport system ATP-binding protein